MSYAIIRGANGRRHEVDFGDDEITVSVHASTEVVDLRVEAQDDDRPWEKRRFVHLNIPLHLLSKAMADLARHNRGKPPAEDDD